MPKYIKPTSCDLCPAVEKEKQTIRCGCMRSLSAGMDNQEEKILMWRKCPLGWDTKENKC